MNIRIYKCSDETLKREIRDLTTFALELMFKSNRKKLNNVHVSIKLDHEEVSAENAVGLCTWTDQIHNPKKFLIKLSDKLSKKTFRKTLFHELVHVKQYLTSELKDFYTGEVRWKKKIYEDTETYHIEDYYAYMNTPWEKQAYRMSENLYKKYVHK